MESLKIAVYCSSRGDLPADVAEGARIIAQTIGRLGATMVYGGVNAGLMHTVAEAAAAAGARICGVVPEVFSDRADSLVNDLILARDLNDRKGRMIAMADMFIVLPGGIGTIDEWISTLSDIMVRERVDPSADKPIIVWNHNGMYSALGLQLAETDASVYARGKRVDRSRLLSTAREVAAEIEKLVSGECHVK